MTIDSFKLLDRCDEYSVHRWESEGGSLGIMPQPRRAETCNGLHDFVAAREGSAAAPASTSGKGAEHAFRSHGRLPRRASDSFINEVSMPHRLRHSSEWT